jgi:hypothetical protein
MNTPEAFLFRSFACYFPVISDLGQKTGSLPTANTTIQFRDIPKVTAELGEPRIRRGNVNACSKHEDWRSDMARKDHMAGLGK